MLRQFLADLFDPFPLSINERMARALAQEPVLKPPKGYPPKSEVGTGAEQAKIDEAVEKLLHDQ